MKINYLYIIIAILTISNISLFMHMEQQECIASPIKSKDAYLPKEEIIEVNTAVKAYINNDTTLGELKAKLEKNDSNQLENNLTNDLENALEMQADDASDQVIEIERTAIVKIQNSALAINEENIKELDELLVVMNDFNTKVNNSNFTNHLLDSVIINPSASQEIKYRILSHLDGADVAERLTDLEQIVQDSAEMEPWLAWQALTLISENSTPEDNEIFFSTVRDSSYYPDYFRETAEKLISGGDKEGSFDIRSPKHYEKLGPLFDIDSEY